jgi:hypothetical protein
VLASSEQEAFLPFRPHFDLDTFYCPTGIEDAHEKGGVEGEITLPAATTQSGQTLPNSLNHRGDGNPLSAGANIRTHNQAVCRQVVSWWSCSGCSRRAMVQRVWSAVMSRVSTSSATWE